MRSDRGVLTIGFHAQAFARLSNLLERLQKFALQNKLLDKPVFGIPKKPRVGRRERLPTPSPLSRAPVRKRLPRAWTTNTALPDGRGSGSA